MVETGTFATPDTTITMAAFTMYGVGKTFAENTPLHGKILVVIEGRTFVGTPAHRAMVDNDGYFPTKHHLPSFSRRPCGSG